MLKIVIADESVEVSKSLAAILSEIEGVAVVSCEHRREQLLATLDRLRPDVLVMDLQMAGQSYVSVLHQITQAQPPPKLVLLSHGTSLALKERCLHEGAAFLFRKTTELEPLAEAIKRLVDEHQAAPQPGPP